jgi:hypothetical protein
MLADAVRWPPCMCGANTVMTVRGVTLNKRLRCKGNDTLTAHRLDSPALVFVEQPLEQMTEIKQPLQPCYLLSLFAVGYRDRHVSLL